MDYKEYFKGKKITQMGLGLLGRGVGDAQFLAECGVDLIVTDMKTAEELAPSLEKLKSFLQIKFKLGGHDIEDFKNCDMVLKAAGVPLDSIYIAEASRHNIPVKMDASLFCELAPEGVITIGVTGTRGKSTVTHLIYHILKTAGKSAYLAGNIRDMATLPLLKDVKSGDYVVFELDSWQLQGFGESKISPRIAVFTNLMEDHKNYYKDNPEQYFEDKANIYKFQNEKDFLVVGESLSKIATKSQKLIASANSLPKDWSVMLIGEHNLENVACAVEACRTLGISEEDIKKGVESFGGVEGRLQFVREIEGVKIYNDNNATTPEATIAALKSLGEANKLTSLQASKLILICGGSDKGLDIDELKIQMAKCKAVIALPGLGTDRLDIDMIKASDLKEAVAKAREMAVSGDTILFSPAFTSFGLFKNEYERNDHFLAIVRSL